MVEYNEWKEGFIYKPKICGEKPLKATLGVKFCQDTFLLKSFLDQMKIEYKIEELEKTPLGLALRIKKDGISENK